MYSALDLAKYIVNYCYKKYKPVSNLKLQKMLYFIWVDYYKNNCVKLFNEKFYAWQFGPVVTETYYEFCSYAGVEICKTYDVNLANEDLLEINQLIEKYIDTPVRKLVEMTHKENGPWDMVYNKGAGPKKEIPFDVIIRLEVA